MGSSLSACSQGASAPRAQNGTLSLTNRLLEDGPVALVGEWEICWGELVSAANPECHEQGWQRIAVPGLWSDAKISSPIGGKGVASYRLELVLPPDQSGLSLRVGSPMTAYQLWIDGMASGGAGRVGTSRQSTTPRLENRVVDLPSHASRISLLAHVANFDFRGGGIRRTWHVGTHDEISSLVGRELLRDGMLAATSTAIGLLFFAQFALQRRDRARGWFGLFATGVGLRVLAASSSDVPQLVLPWASFGGLIRAEYLGTAVLLAIAPGYFLEKAPGVMPTKLTRGLQLAALSLVPIVLLAPLDWALATLPAIQVLPPLIMALVVVSYGQAYRLGVHGVGGTLIASSLWIVGISHDVFRVATGWGAAIELFPFFVVVWMANEAHSLLQSYSNAFSEIEDLSSELQEANLQLQETEEAVARFVPFDLLSVLGRKTANDIRLGDRVEVEMAVMTCDLRLRGSRSASRELEFAGELMERLLPILKSHGGLVGPPQGSTVVALFGSGASDAVAAASGLQRDVAGWAESRDESPKLGIGIASGRVAIGTVGTPENLSSVVIGEAVSLSRQVQELSSTQGLGVLISEASCETLAPGLAEGMRELAVIESSYTGEPCRVFAPPMDRDTTITNDPTAPSDEDRRARGSGKSVDELPRSRS